MSKKSKSHNSANSNPGKKLIYQVQFGGAPLPEAGPQEHVVIHDPGIDCLRIAKLTESLHSDELRPIALTFSRSIDRIQHLIAFPIPIISYFIIPAQLPEMYIRALDNLDLTGQSKLTEQEIRKVSAEVERLRSAEVMRLSTDNTLIKEAIDVLSQMIEIEPVGSAIQSILFAGITSAWTSFECLVIDVWKEALNARPMQLGQNAAGKLPPDLTSDYSTSALGEITGKMVQISLLAKYEFDLRNHLGDMLSSKFDFTRPIGIKTAYSAAFGKDCPILNVVDETPLKNLHLTRNVIVHRAGVIDLEYKLKKTDCLQEIGEMIAITGTSDVAEYTNAAVEAGCMILEFVDQWLMDNPNSSINSTIE